MFKVWARAVFSSEGSFLQFGAGFGSGRLLSGGCPHWASLGFSTREGTQEEPERTVTAFCNLITNDILSLLLYSVHWKQVTRARPLSGVRITQGREYQDEEVSGAMLEAASMA